MIMPSRSCQFACTHRQAQRDAAACWAGISTIRRLSLAADAAEHAEMGQELFSGIGKLGGQRDRGVRVRSSEGCTGRDGAFDVVALSSQAAEPVECVPGLAPDRDFDGIVPAARGASQSLLNKQGDTGETRCVVCQRERAIWVRADGTGRCGKGAACFRQPGSAARGSACHRLKLSAGDAAFDRHPSIPVAALVQIPPVQVCIQFRGCCSRSCAVGTGAAWHSW